jgi:hypothetical protein
MRRFRPSSHPSSQPNPSESPSRYVYRHHLRDLQGAVGASIGKGFDVLSRQLHTLNSGKKPRK